jgi:MbtH protein
MFICLGVCTMSAGELLPQTWPETWSVVRDREDRYSVWADDKALPVGWSKGPISGTRDECLQKIKEIWVDPRPLGLRQAMA